MSGVLPSPRSILWDSVPDAPTNTGSQSQQPLIASGQSNNSSIVESEAVSSLMLTGNESPLPNLGNCLLPCSNIRIGRSLRRSTRTGYPINGNHNDHVTSNRLQGLPYEIDVEVHRNFGVPVELMQLSQDWRGNSVPTILLAMQKCLYDQNGLKNEGIFRVNAENTQSAYLQLQLNHGIVLDDTEPYCLAGLIKAWFRDLPKGVMDTLPVSQVMQAETEDECAGLVELLPRLDACLFNWVINLMADVVQEEDVNQMNAHNVAVVFAPNMTRMGGSLLADPSTALRYVGQLVSFIKILILKTLKDRKAAIPVPDLDPASGPEPAHENRDQCSSLFCEKKTTVKEDHADDNDDIEQYHEALTDFESPRNSALDDHTLVKGSFRFHADSVPVLMNQSFHITETGNPKAPFLFTQSVHLTRTLSFRDLVDLNFQENNTEV